MPQLKAETLCTGSRASKELLHGETRQARKNDASRLANYCLKGLLPVEIVEGFSF